MPSAGGPFSLCQLCLLGAGHSEVNQYMEQALIGRQRCHGNSHSFEASICNRKLDVCASAQPLLRAGSWQVPLARL